MIYKLKDETRKDLVSRIKDGDTKWPPAGECAVALDLMAPKSLPQGDAEADRAAWLGDGYLSASDLASVFKKMIDEGTAEEVSETDTRSSAVPMALLETICRTAFQASGSLGAHWETIPHKEELVGRLKRIGRELNDLKAELRLVRQRHIAEQLRRLGIAADAKDLRLNVGAGEGSAPGWINVDGRSNDLSLNIAEGLPFADGSARYIYSSHILEHFHYKGEALLVLKEFKRVLRAGGVARILVPDTELLLQAYARRDCAFFAERKRHFFWERVCRTPMEQILKLSGGSVKPGDFFRHKWGYDFDTLEGALLDAGFSAVKRSRYMASEHPELNLDNLGQSASIKIGGARTSLFVEATVR